MKIGLLADWMDAERDYPFMEEQMRNIFPTARFKRDLWPHQIPGECLDLYVIDFGGTLPGCEDTVMSHMRELVRQIEENPSVTFLIWTEMTVSWYTEAIAEENPELKAPNVIICDWNGEWSEKLKHIFGH